MGQKLITDVVNFVSGINPKSIAALIEITGKARNNMSNKIILNISSPGRDLPSAFAAYYHLRSLGISLVSHNMGNIESSAVLLYLAADTRLAAPHSRFLLHPFSTGLLAVKLFTMRSSGRKPTVLISTPSDTAIFSMSAPRARILRLMSSRPSMVMLFIFPPPPPLHMEYAWLSPNQQCQQGLDFGGLKFPMFPSN